MAKSGATSRKHLVLMLGGARSGKSTYAEGLAARLAGETGRVLYVATAQALDEEMTRRIDRHRRDRPVRWHTLEEPLDPGAAIVRAWDSLARPGGSSPIPRPEPVPIPPLPGAGEAHDVVLVDCVTLWLSKGMSLVPPYPLGRVYRDLLGRVNAWLAAAADAAYLLVAGLPLRIKPDGGTSCLIEGL
jgi:adenosylcobinamide kinase / adenosylcobinamide-phosphate guanylyltransferase